MTKVPKAMLIKQAPIGTRVRWECFDSGLVQDGVVYVNKRRRFGIRHPNKATITWNMDAHTLHWDGQELCFQTSVSDPKYTVAIQFLDYECWYSNKKKPTASEVAEQLHQQFLKNGQYTHQQRK